MLRDTPPVGFGTWLLEGSKCADTVELAAGEGYRLFDTATAYGNLSEVGEGLRRFGREKCYLASKVWHDSLAPARIRADLETTLAAVGSHYLDAYLIHWPSSEEPVEGTLGAMVEAQTEGKVRDLGICNITVNHLRRLDELGVVLKWVQVEMNPLFWDRELLEECSQRGIAVQGWAPLARGALAGDSLLIAIGARHGKSATQVALKWGVQHGCMPIVKCSSETHMRENLALDFALSEEEMARIDAHPAQRERERLRAELGLGFTDEFDYTAEQCWPD